MDGAAERKISKALELRDEAVKDLKKFKSYVGRELKEKGSPLRLGLYSIGGGVGGWAVGRGIEAGVEWMLTPKPEATDPNWFQRNRRLLGGGTALVIGAGALIANVAIEKEYPFNDLRELLLYASIGCLLTGGNVVYEETKKWALTPAPQLPTG